MISASPSDTGLFYFPDCRFEEECLITEGEEELNHLLRVMRKQAGDQIFVTDGKGQLIFGEIVSISTKLLTLKIIQKSQKMNPYGRFTVFLPILKNPDRFEFALEKSVELGFTDFLAIRYHHSVKPKVNLERLKLKAVSAMKQSLRTFLPTVGYADTLESGLRIGMAPLWFDQNAGKGLIKDFLDTGGNYSLVVGPEGGFSAQELDLLRNWECFRMSDGRLRAETAVITAASLLAYKIEFQ
ncbi:MAG: Ribosomal RNA small subunit methyltransferase E [Ignavibacteriaceae bacterium]|nr:Ribosomal RNA small subunit methyltransferase E [Ignavibacteriaceae bacterium]